MGNRWERLLLKYRRQLTAIGVQTDISDEESLDNLLWETQRMFSPVEVLVNIAVFNHFYPTVEFPTKFWTRGFDVMVHAPFMLSKKVLPSMSCRNKWIGKGKTCFIFL